MKTFVSLSAALFILAICVVTGASTQRRFHGIITAVEPASITIQTTSNRSTVKGKIDPSRTHVLINGKPATAKDLKVTFTARGELCLDDVWLTLNADSK